MPEGTAVSTGRPTASVLAVFISDGGVGWLPSLISLRDVGPPVVVGSVRAGGQDLPATPDVVADSLAEFVTTLAASAAPDVNWLVVAGEPTLVPSALLDRLAEFEDERFASISFLSNSAGPVSFPFAGTPVPWTLNGADPDSLTERLRSFEPLPAPVPIPVAAGPVIAFSTAVVRMLPPGWDSGAATWSEAIAGFALAAQARGLVNLLDSTTFVHRAADLRPIGEVDPVGQARLVERFPWYPTAVSLAVSDPSSPLRLEHAVARVKVSGLDVLLDGSCLGPTEMGTQVGLLAIARSLVQRADVSSVAITLPNEVPSYARSLLEEPRVSFVPGRIGRDIESERRFDVAFRPFQPDSDFDAARLRKRADRVIVSLLDLIAFQNGSYFASGDAWVNYRGSILDAIRRVDGVTTISHDVVGMIELERLPIAPDRVYPVPYGTEHLNDSAPRRMPEGFDAAPGTRFIVSLGTNYGHKNRDLAIRALSELRTRGHELKLVLVGPAVPFGSSRVHEAAAMMDLQMREVITMANVGAEERNWLLAHAEVVIYPTSAEGFGLVPYEAAWLGTPTVFVPFGPLAEIAGDLPIAARDWTAVAFADAVEALLVDPHLSALQVDRLQRASVQSTWPSTAAMLCNVFLSVLAKPAIST